MALEQPGDARDDRIRFARKAHVGDPHHPDPVQQQVLLTEAVALEGGVGPVRRVGVQFDREAVLGPVDVELEAMDDEVGRGTRRPAARTASRKRRSKPERVKATGM